VAGANELIVNEAGTSKKASVYQLMEFMQDKGADVASAGTTVLGDGSYFHITGTSTITDIDFATSWDGRIARLVFDGILTLTHNATTLILPGGQNIVTGPGDSCTVCVDSGDNIKVIQFERAAQVQDSNPKNQSTASQSPAAAATTYLTSSNIAIPPSGLRVGTTFYWRLVCTKTAAGTLANSILVKLGTAGTTSDATILTFTLPAGTGAIDTGIFDIFVTIRGPLGASCIAQGHLTGSHKLAELVATELTGIMTQRNCTVLVTSGTFTSSTAGLIIGLAWTAAASQAYTFTQIIAESGNL
jgi:hypothetical protein